MKNLIISRRRALQGAGMLAAAGMLPDIRFALANVPTDKRLIVYIARGAMDGLATIPAYGDKDYVEARGAMALSKDLYLPLDGFYGVHRNLGSFEKLFRRKQALAVHAVATPFRERSHFEAQNVLESGLAAPQQVAEGWLNRVLAIYGDEASRKGLAFGQSLPLMLQGAVHVPCWAPSEQGLPEPQLLKALEKMYAEDKMFSNALTGAINVHGIVDDAMGKNMPGTIGGDGNINVNPIDFTSGSEMKLVPNKVAVQDSIKAVSKLMSDPKGPRIAVFDQGGWDTHVTQGTADGIFPFCAMLLDAALQTFREELGAHWKNTVFLVVTEFGRTVAGNGTQGTDHGTASCVLLAGGAVNGGKILGDWPGLSKDKQYKGRDLAPTTDMRSVIKTVLSEHLDIDGKILSERIFPGSGDVPVMEGLVNKA